MPTSAVALSIDFQDELHPQDSYIALLTSSCGLDLSTQPLNRRTVL